MCYQKRASPVQIIAIQLFSSPDSGLVQVVQRDVSIAKAFYKVAIFGVYRASGPYMR